MDQNTSNGNVLEVTADISSGRVATLTCMVILNIVALVANFTVIFIIFRTAILRYNLTYFFVINLCILNILGSVLVVPVSIIVFVKNTWLWGDTFCVINGFINCFLLFATVLNVCLISVERFYAIKMPMHHSGNLTFRKTITVIVSVMIYSAFMASLPLYGWNSYDFHPARGHCSFAWKTDEENRTFIIFAGLMCFVIPGCVLICMYIAIFNVARAVSRQIHPSSNNSNICSSDSCSIDVSKVNNVFQCEQISSPNFTQHLDNSSLRDQHPLTSKAFRTLLLIVFLYMFLWGPYFLLYIIAACVGEIRNGYFWEALSTWLAYASFAVNPFIYGWMNKPIREELFKFFKKMCCSFGRLPQRESLSASVLNILDILERSNARPKQATPIQHTSCKDSPTMDLESAHSEATHSYF